MELTVNGRDQQVRAGTTLAELVGKDANGVAVAVNEEMVPRSAWPATRLHAGDRVEMLEARQGG